MSGGGGGGSADEEAAIKASVDETKSLEDRQLAEALARFNFQTIALPLFIYLYLLAKTLKVGVNLEFYGVNVVFLSHILFFLFCDSAFSYIYLCIPTHFNKKRSASETPMDTSSREESAPPQASAASATSATSAPAAPSQASWQPG